MLQDILCALRAAVREFKRRRWAHRQAKRWENLPF